MARSVTPDMRGRRTAAAGVLAALIACGALLLALLAREQEPREKDPAPGTRALLAPEALRPASALAVPEPEPARAPKRTDSAAEEPPGAGGSGQREPEERLSRAEAEPLLREEGRAAFERQLPALMHAFLGSLDELGEDEELTERALYAHVELTEATDVAAVVAEAPSVLAAELADLELLAERHGRALREAVERSLAGPFEAVPAGEGPLEGGADANYRYDVQAAGWEARFFVRVAEEPELAALFEQRREHMERVREKLARLVARHSAR